MKRNCWKIYHKNEEMIMSLSTEDLVKIVEAGGGLTLEAGSKSKDDLVTIATGATNLDVILTLKNVTALTVDDLVEIARAGDGCVTFEL